MTPFHQTLTHSAMRGDPPMHDEMGDRAADLSVGQATAHDDAHDAFMTLVSHTTNKEAVCKGLRSAGQGARLLKECSPAVHRKSSVMVL